MDDSNGERRRDAPEGAANNLASEASLENDLTSLPTYDKLGDALGDYGFFENHPLTESSIGKFYLDVEKTIPAGNLIFESTAALKNSDLKIFPDLVFRPTFLSGKVVYELSYRTGDNCKIIEIIGPNSIDDTRTKFQILRMFYQNARTQKVVEITSLLGEIPTQTTSPDMFSANNQNHPVSEYHVDDGELEVGVSPRENLDKPIHEVGHRYRRELASNPLIRQARLWMQAVVPESDFSSTDLRDMARAIYTEEVEASKLELRILNHLQSVGVLSGEDRELATKIRLEKLKRYKEMLIGRVQGLSLVDPNVELTSKEIKHTAA